MGTNYYLYPKPPCECCGRAYEDERLHIGKSSIGWCFGLHIIPDEGLNNLADWEVRWNKPGAVIQDEYGTVVSPEDMLAWIMLRSREKADFSQEWLTDNHAIQGPNGLARRKIGRYCSGYGDGPYDLIPCEFS